MTFTEAAAEVLRLVGKPLHYKDITEIAIQRNLLSHVGKSPEETMGARLASLLKKDIKENPLVRLKPGIFALRSWEESGPPGFAPDNDLLPPYGPGPKKEPSVGSSRGTDRRENRGERGQRRPRPEMPSEVPIASPQIVAPLEDLNQGISTLAGVEEAPLKESIESHLQDSAVPRREEETSGEILIETHPEESDPEIDDQIFFAEEAHHFTEEMTAESISEEAPAREEAPISAEGRTESTEVAEIAPIEGELEPEEEEFRIAAPPPTLLLAEEDLAEIAAEGSILLSKPEESNEEEVTAPLPLRAVAEKIAQQPGNPPQERRREERSRRRDRVREDASAPASDEMMRADLVAGAMEVFSEEEDDDQPILGDTTAEPRAGRRRRRRRSRGSEGKHPDMEGLPSYTVSPAFGDTLETREEHPQAEPRRDERSQAEPRRDERSQAEPRRDERSQAEPRRDERSAIKMLPMEGDAEEIAGRDMIELLLNAMGGFERNGGPVPLRNVAESLLRRNRISGEIPQVVGMMQAAVRADNARRSAEGKRPRFRLIGGRIALTDWSMSQDLLRLEGEMLAATERYRDASRRFFAKKMGELPGHAFVELCLIVLERLGVSQFKGIKRQGNAGEVHFTGVLRGPGGETRLAILIRKDAREISRERVIEARGSLHHYTPATALWLLTPGQILSGAREEAQAPGAAPVALFDGVGLAKLCDEYGLGVMRTVLPVSLLDLDFFESLRSS